MITRRNFMKHGTKVGLAAATAPLWSNLVSRNALAQSIGSQYKAIVVITLTGGNDGNNFVVPMDSEIYAQYASVRGLLALSAKSLLPLANPAGGRNYGFHPAMQNVTRLYNSKRALIVANAGPMVAPATKRQLLSGQVAMPAGVASHPVGVAQWESAATCGAPSTGWGGRIADVLVGQSGMLPPVLSAAQNSIFTVGQTVQAVTVQGGDIFSPLPAALNTAVLQIAQNDSGSSNAIVAQAARFRATAMQEQVLLNQAAAYGTIRTVFPSSGFGTTLQTIANVIHGRSVIGANRQIFYAQQGAGSYDTHGSQFSQHGPLLADLDAGLGAFFAALDELGLANQVLVCTHSDFSRTVTSNTSGGSDHAWANHQLIIGGGISGGRIVGSMPDFELGGAMDIGTQGVWIPTTSVTQMTAAIGSWLGLNTAQIAEVFPALGNFPSGMIQL